MDQFRTIIPAPEFPFYINHASNALLIGSCFAENMGHRLCANKIPARVNPFGILFNPFSVMNALERMLNNRLYKESELLEVNEHWVSLDHHGRFKSLSAQDTLQKINQELEAGTAALKSADVIFITLGSAWVYRHIERSHLVANCHKIPNKAFRKELLSHQDVHLILRHIPQFLASKKISAPIVFTVSPVRHWKDGAIENQRSKATLLSAVHEVVNEFEQCHYFPAYEYMMDDLRDYRFYGSDMIHPTEQAIDYVWQRFSESFFDETTTQINQELKSVVEASQHRPLDPESNSFQRFILKQMEIIDDLESKYPEINLEAERKKFDAFRL